MPHRGKRYLTASKLVDRTKQYDPKEALALLMEMAKAKFDETVEAHYRLGIDPRRSDQQVRGAVVLPHGTGKTKRVLVFAKGEKIREAEEAGADYAGGDELAEKISKLGKILGPRGLMPNPKTGTVTFDVAKAVAEIKAGKVEYRVDKTGIVHVPIGKVSFGVDKLYQNLAALMDASVGGGYHEPRRVGEPAGGHRDERRAVVGGRQSKEHA